MESQQREHILRVKIAQIEAKAAAHAAEIAAIAAAALLAKREAIKANIEIYQLKLELEKTIQETSEKDLKQIESEQLSQSKEAQSNCTSTAQFVKPNDDQNGQNQLNEFKKSNHHSKQANSKIKEWFKYSKYPHTKKSIEVIKITHHCTKHKNGGRMYVRKRRLKYARPHRKKRQKHSNLHARAEATTSNTHMQYHAPANHSKISATHFTAQHNGIIFNRFKEKSGEKTRLQSSITKATHRRINKQLLYFIFNFKIKIC
jgi:hypothetical protein